MFCYSHELSITTWVGGLSQGIVSVGSIPLCISRRNQDIISVNVQTLRLGVEYWHQDALQKKTNRTKDNKRYFYCDFGAVDMLLNLGSRSSRCVLCLHTDLSWISIEHHEAKFLRADTAEEDIKWMVGGYDAVEERHSLLAGVACTPPVILRT